MSLLNVNHDSLPCTSFSPFPATQEGTPLTSITADIDRPPSPSSLAAAHALINSSLPSAPQSLPSHSSLPPLPSPQFSPLVIAELSRIASKEPFSAIDTSRYEAPADSDSPDVNTLRQAYISSSYLIHRQQTLALLEEFGKNAWLVHNSQLEDILRRLEKEVLETKEEVEAVNRERKRDQEGKRDEIEGLERDWREGIGRVLEVGVGVGEVENAMRDAMKAGA